MKYTAPAMERKQVAGMLGLASATCQGLGVLCAPGLICEDTPTGPQCVPA